VYAHQQIEVHLNRRPSEIGPCPGPTTRVLAVLSGHDGDRMPARDLCNTLSWEKSRLSHQVRRMQKDGLISREPNPDDARSTPGLPAPGWPPPPSRRRRPGHVAGRPPQLHRPAHPG